MRIFAAVAVIGACVLWSTTSADPLQAPDRVIAHALGGRIAKTERTRQRDDTCRWAHDRECDEPGIGTGACREGTDWTDCFQIRNGENDSCRWANDGECDEPQFGTGACAQGSDRTDCGDIAALRNENDSCDTAFNGVCDIAGQGSGLCAPHTDRADCVGRDRPANIQDHFFGHDDRVLVPASDSPWRFVGRYLLDSGEMCSAVLIGRDIALTAANCVFSGKQLEVRGRFVNAEGAESRVVGYLLDEHYDNDIFLNSNQRDGSNWALLRLATPIGDRLGHANVRDIITGHEQEALSADLMQAGFAWDTGEHLAANLHCRILTTAANGTFEHNCDTTRGDAGSPLMVVSASGVDVIGLDSHFDRHPGQPPSNVAISASMFASAVDAFAAGSTGTNIR